MASSLGYSTIGTERCNPITFKIVPIAIDFLVKPVGLCWVLTLLLLHYWHGLSVPEFEFLPQARGMEVGPRRLLPFLLTF